VSEPPTLRGRCREGLGVQQLQGALALVEGLPLHSRHRRRHRRRRGLLGPPALLVVQLAALGEQPGAAGFGRGLHHQAGLLLLTTRVLL